MNPPATAKGNLYSVSKLAGTWPTYAFNIGIILGWNWPSNNINTKLTYLNQNKRIGL
jgi:hypothetical protein